MREGTRETRAHFIRLGEQLFSEKGVTNVTIAEINKASGQKNRSALQYHFGDKLGLLDALINKHMLQINDDRNRLLDDIAAKTEVAARDVAEAIVLPLARRLEDPDGGVEYVRIAAQLISSKDYPLLNFDELSTNIFTERMLAMASRIAPSFSKKVQFSRVTMTLSLLFHGLSDYAQMLANDNRQIESVETDVFVSDLVDVIEWIQTKPVSAKTLQLLAAEGE